MSIILDLGAVCFDLGLKKSIPSAAPRLLACFRGTNKNIFFRERRGGNQRLHEVPEVKRASTPKKRPHTHYYYYYETKLISNKQLALPTEAYSVRCPDPLASWPDAPAPLSLFRSFLSAGESLGLFIYVFRIRGMV